MKNLLISLQDFECRKFQKNNWEIIDTTKIKKQTANKILKKILQNKHNKVLIGSSNWEGQTKKIYLKATLWLARGKTKRIIDMEGREIHVSTASLLSDGFLFLTELIASHILFWHLKVTAFLLSHQKISHIQPTDKITSLAYFRTDFTFKTLAGGSVGHIAGVINAIHHNKIATTVYSMEPPLCLDQEIPVVRIKPNPLFNNLSEMPENLFTNTFCKKVAKKFAHKKPDAIYQRYSAKNFSGVLLSRKFKIPLILEYNGPEVWAAKHWGKPFIHQQYAEKVEKLNIKHAHLIVVVSRAIKNDLLKLGIKSEKILVQSNCIDPQKFHPQINGLHIRKKYHLQNKIVVGFIGTFGKWHGVEILAKTIKPTIQKNSMIHFLFMGDGVMRPEVEKIIRENKIENHVTLTGLIPQEEAPKYLAACDIVTSPTIPNPDGTPFFGSPTKLFEYMGMCKAIVASQLDQIGEVLEDGKTGLLITPGNIKELSKKILELAANPELRKTLGENAHKEVISKYTWDRNIENVLKKLQTTFNPVN